jgi:hypothetical protein
VKHARQGGDRRQDRKLASHDDDDDDDVEEDASTSWRWRSDVDSRDAEADDDDEESMESLAVRCSGRVGSRCRDKNFGCGLAIVASVLDADLKNLVLETLAAAMAMTPMASLGAIVFMVGRYYCCCFRWDME